MRSRKRIALVALAASGVVALLLATWATGAVTSTSAAPTGSGKASPTKSVCGLGTGKKATGKAINIGAIVTVAPGVNWDEITDNARAYFNCVNDNGGINGRPINYIVHVDPINPELVAAFAKKLIEEEKVVAHRREHRRHGLRRECAVLRVEEVLRHRRRRARPLLRRDAVPHPDQHGPGVQHARRGSVSRPGWCQRDDRVGRSDRRRRRGHVEQARRRLREVEGPQGHRRP